MRQLSRFTLIGKLWLMMAKATYAALVVQVGAALFVDRTGDDFKYLCVA